MRKGWKTRQLKLTPKIRQPQDNLAVKMLGARLKKFAEGEKKETPVSNKKKRKLCVSLEKKLQRQETKMSAAPAKPVTTVSPMPKIETGRCGEKFQEKGETGKGWKVPGVKAQRLPVWGLFFPAGNW